MRVLTLAVLLLAAVPWQSCASRELSEAAVEELFAKHKESDWRLLAERWSDIKAKMDAPVERLSLPLEYFPSGLVKARLYAEQAQIFPDGMVFATGVRVQLYDESGKRDGYLKAEDCLYDRQASHGYCKGKAEVLKGSDLIKGVGIYFSIPNEFIRILSNCEIRTNRFQGNLGRLL
ncbi:MAG: hypothetical protein PHO37_18445 [Kiritimatiellae bacterium]|nr:hypothetical protein [Kiritimatiellia bacterium]